MTFRIYHHLLSPFSKAFFESNGLHAVLYKICSVSDSTVK